MKEWSEVYRSLLRGANCFEFLGEVLRAVWPFLEKAGMAWKTILIKELHITTVTYTLRERTTILYSTVAPPGGSKMAKSPYSWASRFCRLFRSGVGVSSRSSNFLIAMILGRPPPLIWRSEPSAHARVSKGYVDVQFAAILCLLAMITPSPRLFIVI